MKTIGLIILVIILALLGGLVKIIGGILYGSRSLLVDALTSFANIVSLTAILYYYRISLQPPDKDHHYGHERLGYAGVLTTMLSYSFVAGLSAAMLITSGKYTVEEGSVYMAALGFVIYAVTVLLSMRIGGFLKTYGAFTVSELIESIVVILACTGGVYVSYIIDYIGAIGLTLYIFYELVESFRDLLVYMADRAPSRSVVEDIIGIVEKHGLNIVKYRFRIVSPGKIHGDIIIETDPDLSLEEINKVIEKVKKEIGEKYIGTDIVFEARPSRVDSKRSPSSQASS